jgi:AcrR family transcriptional regulator
MLFFARKEDIMPRKIKFDRDQLLEVAFEMARTEDITSITARKLAGKAECSTQPIFRAFEGMQEVINEVFRLAMEYFDSYYKAYDKKAEIPFVDLGMAYISFAKRENYLFKLLFLSEFRGTKSMYELLNGSNNAVGHEITKAKAMRCVDPSTTFMKMWIFIHGAACMTITGDFDLSEKETANLLEEQYNSCS